ncbi:histidine kinase [Verrucomicrobiaceae bacterium N1E253]|uniref:Histidine kinase n=1 Tax=Oceaniferula marina TaxID=2748318 RepID=A0A851GAY5_9BACT|nr:histidine kinase [Oceaniferula marina]NWK54339.1 histidine kinase [Oceaniferula marina]
MERFLKALLVVCAFLLAWVLLTLVLTAQLTYSGAPWTSGLLVSVEQMLPWFIASPLLIYVSYRFPILYDRWWLHTALHSVLCLLIMVGIGRTREFILEEWPTLIPPESRVPQAAPASSAAHPEPIAIPGSSISSASLQNNEAPIKSDHWLEKTGVIRYASQSSPLGIPLYVTILFIFSLTRYRDEIKKRDQEALKLESQLVQTQLNLLRSQLQPHFLFNTLNTISTLIHTSPDNADAMVIQLSKLLRRTLDQRNDSMIPLQQEVETLKIYLEIQGMRFGDRMQVDYLIEDDTKKVDVPPMIVLPLVENAVRYGVEKSSKATTITIRSHLEGKQLHLDVIDDGPGINPENQSGTGVGLGNTQSRLETLYPGKSASVTLIEQEDHGVIAHIELPLP